MSRFERCLLYGMSVAVLAWLLTSGLGGRDREPVRSTVHAANCHDNHKLDVLRRGISFAQKTSVGERDRAENLERVSVLFESMSLGALQNAASHAHETFLKERERGHKLEKSSVPGDRMLAKDALLRSQDWHKVERILRGLYVSTMQRMTKEIERNKTRAEEARQRAEAWRGAERELRGIFAAEVGRMRKGAALSSPADR